MTELSPQVKARQAVEREIFRAVVDALLAGGFALSLDNGACEDDPNGGYEIAHSTDAEAIVKASMATDEERLYAEKNGKRFGWVLFIYGEDGWDVINDYTINLEQWIGDGTAVQVLIDKHCEGRGW